MWRRTGPSLLRVTREGLQRGRLIPRPEGWEENSYKVWDYGGVGEQGHVDNIKVNIPKGEMAGPCAYERQLFKMVLDREAWARYCRAL